MRTPTPLIKHIKHIQKYSTATPTSQALSFSARKAREVAMWFSSLVAIAIPQWDNSNVGIEKIIRSGQFSFVLKYTYVRKKNILKITKMIFVYLFAGLWRLWALVTSELYVDSLRLNNGRVKRTRCKLKIVNYLYPEMRINTVGNSFLNNFWFCFSFSHIIKFEWWVNSNWGQHWLSSALWQGFTIISVTLNPGHHL